MTIVNGIDGKTEKAFFPSNPCKPVHLCSIDLCSFVCAFVSHAIPQGPLWDQAKQDFIEKFNETYCSESLLLCEKQCATLIDYAAFVAVSCFRQMKESLWPALREANPFTAYDGLSDWLDRYGFENCFLSQNRSDALGPITPYEEYSEPCCPHVVAQGAGGSVPYVPPPNRRLVIPAIPGDLQKSIDKATLISLMRLALTPIQNIDAINFIIDPLGAKIDVSPAFDVWSAVDYRKKNGDFYCLDNRDKRQCAGSNVSALYAPFLEYIAGADDDCQNCVPFADFSNGQAAQDLCPRFRPPLSLTIRPSRDDVDLSEKTECFSFNDNKIKIASYVIGNSGLKIYPAVLVAECIVRKILPDTQNYQLNRK